MALIRYPDWPTKLDAFLRESRSIRFAYGKSDCALWVANCIHTMTGTDIAAPYRRRYTNRSEALQLGRELAGPGGIKTIAERQAQAFDMEEVPVTLARRGDMILVKRPDDHSLGIVSMNGTQILIAAKVGWGPISLSRGIRAWRV